MMEPNRDVVSITWKNIWTVWHLDAEDEIRGERVSSSLWQLNQFATRNARGGEIDVVNTFITLKVCQGDVPDEVFLVKSEFIKIENTFDSAEFN